jgi:lipopolysaccharide/colanic/teichoic acid biosynthesis glycosyltransferase
MIALAIKLDSPGPVLFKQQRTGYLGRRFELLKFRTMVRDAEQQKEQLRHLSIHGQHSPDFKLRDDPRVTRIGRLLRPSSLDELPNLINVLRGEMALVGPRPTSFVASTYAPHQLARLAIRPGVTGLWQISGRSDLDFCTRTELDVEYINRASLWLDLRILLITPFKASKGAY